MSPYEPDSDVDFRRNRSATRFTDQSRRRLVRAAVLGVPTIVAGSAQTARANGGGSDQPSATGSPTEESSVETRRRWWILKRRRGWE